MGIIIDPGVMFSDKGLPSLFTLLGFLGALLAYIVNSIGGFRARRREKATRAIEQLQAFESDTVVRGALRVMDYPGATAVMVAALKSHFRTGTDGVAVEQDFSEAEHMARDNFDWLLSRLEFIEGLIEHGVIAPDEFGDQFNYWLELCGERPKPGDSLKHLSDDAREVLWRYIREYRFFDVIRLFHRYGRAAPVGVLPKDAFLKRSAVAPPLSRWGQIRQRLQRGLSRRAQSIR